MLLFEELALVAINPASGRPPFGVGERLNACLAGLLVAELLLEGAARPESDRDDRIELVEGPEPASASLAAAAGVVAEKGPKIKGVLSGMDRGLHRQLGTGTWPSAVAGLVATGVLAPTVGGLRSHNDILDTAAQAEVVERLQAAAAGDEPLDARTAVLLAMTGPAYLLEVVAPERRTRRHARRRIDDALDRTDLKAITKIVKRLITEAETVAAGAAVIATTSTS